MNSHLLLANDLVHALENQLDILLSDKEIALAKENSQNEVILNLQDGMLKMRCRKRRMETFWFMTKIGQVFFARLIRIL